jgi:hypothetical protein
MDHLISIPSSFVPVQAVEPGTSPTRHIAASLVMLAELLGAKAVWKSPQDFVSAVYEDITGHPDVPANLDSITKDQAVAYLATLDIEAYDLIARFDNLTDLKHEIQALNLAGLPQLIVLAREDKLSQAFTHVPLHNWLGVSEQGQACSIIRVGYNDEASDGQLPYAYYLDGLLPPAFKQPVPIAWQDVENSQLIACLAVLPPGVAVPPESFRFYGGQDPEGHPIVNQWPIPVPAKPEIDVDSLSSTLAAANQALTSASQAVSAAQLAHQTVLALIGKG